MKERYADKTDPKDMQITETGPFTMTLRPTMTLLSCACKRFILLPLRGKTKISKRRALVLLLVLGTFIIYQQQYKVEKYILKTMKTKTLATHKGANQEPRRTIDKLPPMPPVDRAKLKGYHEKDILKTMKTTTLTTHKGANQEPRLTTDKLPPMPPVDRAKLKGYRRVKDECMEYGKAGRINRSVLLGVLGDNTLVNEGDITLITQMTSSRSDKLYRLTVRWSGPISVAVYLEKSINLTSFTKEMQALLAPRKNIALHIVRAEGTFFPVNFLRNVALENAETKYVFLSDIDFEPMPGLDTHLKHYISKGYLQGKTALVVPAFEALYANITFPKKKTDVLKLWKEKKCRPFHFQTVKGRLMTTAGHRATCYSHWVIAKIPYYANWEEYYEPYVVVEKALTPKYWPYFLGRFHNKASHLAELFVMGFSFVVLPDVFIVHTPHKLLQSSDIELRCGTREYSRFKIYLIDKYRWNVPVH